ncbi:hypothetical protein JCM8547_007709 [Rhodosporidiobolus lusitaniae]
MARGPGHCFVCSERTNSLCAGCDDAGFAFWIWFAHQHVCGPRSTPFRFERFSEAEAEEAKRLAKEDDPVDGKTEL